MNAPDDVATDLLHGAESIAEFLFGDRSARRRVYAIARKGHFPAFRLGGVLCARKSTISQWMRKEEAKACAGLGEYP